MIAYDTVGLFSAARAWWMFRVMGHKDVSILDGGLPKWKSEGKPVEDGKAPPSQERHFTARLQTMMVRDRNDVLEAANGGPAQIVDARASGRFAGTTPEPREGLRSGHIPGSLNVPYDKLLNLDGTVRSNEELRAAFAGVGLDTSAPIITSCGSGVTAAVLSLGLTLLGVRNQALYDGSWSEWGADGSLPISTGDDA